MRLSCLAGLAVLVVTACKPGGKPNSPPPSSPPSIPAEAALRPNYDMGGKLAVAGTAFVVADKGGKKFMLTAAHVMDNAAEWGRVKHVSLWPLGGQGDRGTSLGRPLFVGKPFDKAGAAEDLVIWPLTHGSPAPALKLAGGDVAAGEWVWAAGQESGSQAAQKLYLCSVVGPESGGLELRQHDRFELRGFSGGPIVNAQGEVVGSLLGGSGSTVLAAKVSTIRDKLKAAGVEVP